MARILRIPWVKEPLNMKEAAYALAEFRSAERLDRKEEVTMGLVRGMEVDGEQPVSHTMKANIKWTAKLRGHFNGLIIRRTQDSRDIDGASIIDMLPYEDRNLVLTLYEDEYQHLEAMAQQQLHSRVSCFLFV